MNDYNNLFSTDPVMSLLFKSIAIKKNCFENTKNEPRPKKINQ